MSDQLKMHSPNLVDSNIEKIAALFPNCVTEVKGEKGELKKAIDFDLLKQELSQVLVEGEQERYRLDWVGKKESILTANAPIAKTLRPCRDESVNFDKTENLFIEGDNLEALKLLQENYLGKVKMIYIDPPYNTGNDFIYEDDFAESTDEFFERSNQVDEDGNKLVAWKESEGRFHSAWLSMIYSRLRLARNLLKEDGIIFISIDDNESQNLRKICDEVFSENNFVADICVVNNLKGRNDKKYIARANERLFIYVKSQEFNEYGLDLPENVLKEYSEKDASFGPYRLLELRKRGGADTRKERPNMFYPFYLNNLDGSVTLQPTDINTIEVLPYKSNGEEGRWRWAKDTAQKNIKFLVGKSVRNSEKYNIYEKDCLYEDGVIRRLKPKSVMFGADYSTDSATKLYRALMGKIDFNNPKPVPFLEDLITYSTSPKENAIILDFFAGSGSTGHAVYNCNEKDLGNRKFILVQIPEEIDEKTEAFKQNYRFISEITKLRLKKSGELANEKLDSGFRVLKIDSTNMKDVYYTPDAYKQVDILDLADHIKEDRTSEDLLFQVMLDWGLELSLPIERKTIQGKEVFYVAGNSLVACFEELNFAIVDEIAQDKPLRVVSAERAIQLDHDKTNIKERFKQLSPETEVKFI